MASNSHPSSQASLKIIKASASEFKQSLSKLNPWSEKIECQRQSLRNQYLALVFHESHNQLHTQSSSYTREALNLIWLDTSHALINIYRQKISAIDKEISQSNLSTHKKSSRKNARNTSDRPPQSTNLGFVARRKIIQHFRSFLRAEDAFWKSLINRVIEEYRMHDAKRCLKILKILIVNDYPPTNVPLALPNPLSTKTQSISHPNNSSPQDSFIQGILLLHKALIYFGDLIRYSELYSRSGKQGSINNNGSRHEPHKNLVLERDWSRSQECYNQARLLIPTDGNPSNQLAVLSSYIPDLLSSAYHYYRALCVKNPFPTARQNLGMTYQKAFTKAVHPDTLQSTPDPLEYTSNDLKVNSEFLVSQFKSQFVDLHARLYTRRFNSFGDLSVKLCCSFINLLKERLLPPELILKMIVTCMAAAWHARVGWRYVPHHSDPEKIPTSHSYTTELNATIHFLQFSTALLTVAKDELDSIVDLSNTQVEVDLSQNISAVFRRILPVMRIISKWVLCGHFDHIDRIKERLERVKNVKFKSQLSKAEAEFWIQFDDSVELIKKHFPINELPVLTDSIQLEEDLELVGFSPIDRAIRSASNSSLFLPTPSEACHPNEEHLMRLSDFQADSDRIEAKYSIMKTRSKSILITSIQVESSSRSSSSASEESAENMADEVIIKASPYAYDHWVDDDDPVELAMRAVVAQQIDHDEPTGDRPLEFHRFNFQGLKDDDDDEDKVKSVYHPTTRVIEIEKDDREDAVPSRARTRSDSDKKQNFEVGQMSTAADLLASIMSGPGSLDPPNSSKTLGSIQATPTFVTAPLASPITNTGGWASFERFQTNSQVPSFNAAHHARMPSRAPSISLPKPPEGSNNLNIWSNINSISSSISSSSALTSANGRRKIDWPASAAFFG